MRAQPGTGGEDEAAVNGATYAVTGKPVTLFTRLLSPDCLACVFIMRTRAGASWLIKELIRVLITVLVTVRPWPI
jgi:hypothetical protein